MNTLAIKDENSRFISYVLSYSYAYRFRVIFYSSLLFDIDYLNEIYAAIL